MGGTLGLLLLASGNASADDFDFDASITPLPLRYAFVEGDDEKFSAHHWMKENYAGGIEDFSAEAKLPDKITVEAEGHAIIDENDLGAHVRVEKEKFGFMDFEYEEFRKYYDGSGGVYHRFSTLGVNETDKELKLDIGHLKVATGIAFEKLPKIGFLYERHFKDGAKSRLTWTAVRVGAVTRNIGPSWQDIDEIVDTFAIQAEHQIAGFTLKGEQRWEFVRSEMLREEKSLSTTSVASARKIRDQIQEPEADLMTTTAGLERWFLGERLFLGTAYRFAHMDNREVETIFEMNEDRALRNFSNPKQIRDARADNDFDTHTWVGTFMAVPWPWLTGITKFKSEIMKRQSNSTYPQDSGPVAAGGAPPDWIINTTEKSVNDSKITRWGESISLRFTAIPRTAIYNDLEFEQIRNWLSEDRNSLRGQSAPNPNEIFSRETVTDSLRGIWTLGAHTAPWQSLDVTSQIRVRRNNNDFDDKRETLPGANTARSAFFDELDTRTKEFSTKVTLKPFHWLRPSFRYQLRKDDFYSRVENELQVHTETTSHIYSFDVTAEPLKNLLLTTGFSRQTAITRTPANTSFLANTPSFEGNVQTWLFSANYFLIQNIALTGSLLYSQASNFDDFTQIGLPLGVDNERVDLEVGLRCLPLKHLTIEPKYGFYHYEANPLAEFGDYTAHVLWLEFTVAWP
jgi:hypothetical protein